MQVLRLVLLFLICACVVVHVGAASKNTQLEAKRQKICQSNTDCLRIVNEDGGQLLLDDLNFEEDSTDKLWKLLPSWFGARPAVLYRKKGGVQLIQGVKLSDFSFELGEVILLRKTPKKEGEL